MTSALDWAGRFSDRDSGDGKEGLYPSVCNVGRAACTPGPKSIPRSARENPQGVHLEITGTISSRLLKLAELQRR
jgi:hypothetical protein